MNVSTGHWIFAAIFAVVFIIAIFWAYSRDKRYNQSYFKGSYRIILAIVLIFSALFAIVKFKSYLF